VARPRGSRGRTRQINLLAEHEITKLMTLVRGTAHKLDVPEAVEPGLEELERDVRPTRC
jgi:hypothetical protein